VCVCESYIKCADTRMCCGRYTITNADRALQDTSIGKPPSLKVCRTAYNHTKAVAIEVVFNVVEFSALCSVMITHHTQYPTFEA